MKVLPSGSLARAFASKVFASPLSESAKSGIFFNSKYGLSVHTTCNCPLPMLHSFSSKHLIHRSRPPFKTLGQKVKSIPSCDSNEPPLMHPEPSCLFHEENNQSSCIGKYSLRACSHRAQANVKAKMIKEQAQ